MRFGSNNSSVMAFLPANSIEFASAVPENADVLLVGYVSMVERPESWGLPVRYYDNVYLAFYGANMTSGDEYAVLEDSTLRLTSPTNLHAGTTVHVPADSTLVYRPMKFNEATCGSSAIDDVITYGSNDVVLAGGDAMFFRTTQNHPSSITVENGTIAEIMFHGNTAQAQPVTLNCDVDLVSGKGKVVVTGGNRRIGATEATVTVDVQGGAVEFGNGIDLGSVLRSRPVLWLDASDTAKMVGAYNGNWATKEEGKMVLAANPAVKFNGNLAATYTNGFPLIEKWYDKCPEQTHTYGWNDRCFGMTGTLYPLIYPYLVPNGLNGRPYMSFGSHGIEDLPEYMGRSRAEGKDNYRRERRRMPLMHDMAEGKPQGDNISANALILVFGSQQGGGRAIVGSYYGNDRWTTDSQTLGSAYKNQKKIMLAL